QMYRLFCSAVACDFRLPGVPELEEGEADIRIELSQGKASDTGYDWLHSWREEEGELVLSCARKQVDGSATRYLLRFPDLADFVITGDSVTCHPHPDCRDDSLRHLLLDQVIPRLWAQRGYLVLHASAVRLADGRVIAFLGESGWGKSTLAAALQARGAQLLSDDSISLHAGDKGVELIPSYPGLRLNDDSIATLGLATNEWFSVSHYSEKRRFESAMQKNERAHLLDTLYVMVEPGLTAGPPSIKPLSGAELVTTLIKRSFLLDPRDNHSATRQLREVSTVVRAARVCSLAYRRDYLQIGVVCDALLDGSAR
ncbi:MAG: hypothetical protein KDI55_21865, partial [Anaerolineae bacterium]|nr:hypothetical protein [Anaerolineae bacterium]